MGPLRFLDVVAFRAYARLRLKARETAWADDVIRSMRTRYPADLTSIPHIVVPGPNAEEAREFMARLRPDIAIARCKMILKPAMFQLPRVGTFVLHPGICPEYRNAHGCFWALANRDVARAGMTLLKVDAGIDTGPIYLQAGCDIDEVRESHTVIQYRVVLENLDAIGRILLSLCRGEEVATVPTQGRRSETWGQPQLSVYMRWKMAAHKQAKGFGQKALGRPSAVLKPEA